MTNAFLVLSNRGGNAFQVLESSSPSGGEEPGGGGVIPIGLFASFVAVTSTVVEGQAVTVRARLRRSGEATVLPVVCPVVVDGDTSAAADSYALSATEFVWQPGQDVAELTATFTGEAAQGSSRILVLNLDPTVEREEDGSGVAQIGGAKVGPSTTTITVQNEAVQATPTYAFPRATETVPEGAGAVEFALGLDSPAVDVLTFRFRTETIDATAGQDFETLDVQVQVPVGGTQAVAAVTFPENTVDVPADPRLRLIAERVSGTAAAGATTEVEITVEDNDVASAAPFVQFASSPNPEALTEGGSPTTVRASLLRNGQPVAFTERTRVPVTLTGAVSDFEFIWPVFAGELVFEAGATTATFQVRALEDSVEDTGEQVTITIDASSDDVWQVGGANAVTVTSRDPGSEPTQLFMDGLNGSGRRVLRQFSMAVDPPSQTLPAYEYEGERCQVVGLRRDPEGRWVACYVYALDNGNGSIPYRTGAKTVGLPTADVQPSEAGSFAGSAPNIQFQMTLGNGQSFIGDVTNSLTQTVDWTSPTGKWPQVGPDLCRERVHWIRPIRTGAGSVDINTTSGDVCGIINLVEQRIAGEPDIILYEGRFLPGAWRSGQDPFAENPYCDGRIQIQRLDMDAPAGWEWELPDLSPVQSQPFVNRFRLLNDQATDHEFIEARPYTFWAVLRRTGVDANVVARAQQYARCHHIAFAVGSLGPQRHAYYGDIAEMLPDWERAQLRDGSRIGYDAIRQAEEDLKNDPVHSLYVKWANGTASDAAVTGNRLGWLQPVTPLDGNAGGGTLIYGAPAVRPWHHWWFRNRMILHGTVGRHNAFYRDTLDYSAPWVWRVAVQENGQWVNPVQANQNSSWGSFAHWHLTGPPDQLEPGSIQSNLQEADVARFRLSPTTRGWHDSLSGREDPFASVRRGFDGGIVPYDHAHQSRLRPAFNDGWFGRRSPIALLCWEEECARITRTLSPILPHSNEPNDFNRTNSNLAFIKSQRDPQNRDLGKGYWRAGPGQFRQAENHRSWGWPGVLMGGFFSVADDGVRASLRGAGEAAAVNCPAWADEYLGHLAYICTDAGLPFTMISSSTGPWVDEVKYGTTDPVARTGAYTRQGEPNANGLDAVVSKWFFAVFNNRGVATAVQSMLSLPDINATLLEKTPERLREHIRWSHHHQIGLRTKGVQVNRRTNEHVVAAVTPHRFPAGDDGTRLVPFTVADVQGGANAWPLIDIRPGENPSGKDDSYGSQHTKQGWMTEIACRFYGDESYLDQTRYMEGMEGSSDAELLEHLVNGKPSGSVAYELFSTAGGRRRKAYGETTFQHGVIARLINRTS